MIPRGRGQLYLLLTHATVGHAVIFVLRPTMSYRALELGVPASLLGVLSASFALVPLLLALPAGKATDRLGERTVLVTGGVLTCLATGTFLLAGEHVTGLLAGSVLLGTGHLCAAVGQQSLVANTTGVDRYDAAFGYYSFAASLGQAAGPLLIVLFGGTRSIPHTTPIFVAASVLAVALLACSLRLRSGSTSTQREAAASAGVGTLLRTPGMFRALAISCIVLAAVDISLVYLPALGAERGLASGFVGALLGIRAVASMTSRLFLGRLAHAVGRRNLLLSSIAGASVGLGVAAAPVPVWLLTAAVVVAGFGLGVGQPLTMSWLAESAAPGLRGRAMSLRLTGNRVGQVLVPSTVGFVAAGVGAAGVLWVTAFGLACGAVAARKLVVDRAAGTNA